MSTKPRTDRIRQQDADRQQARSDRVAAHKQRVGAEVIKIEMYAGTRRDLELMQQVAAMRRRAKP
ncbi:hypothetical protein [Pseudomonas sp. MBLB4136]|uniref:hypothetical protein n=1 Tax=Pseudomonas sp. MBLB4136 TaxID=3451558 RepID=UPI003F755927